MAEAQLQQFLDKVRQLNAFVALSEADPALRGALRDCEHHDEVVALARRCGFEIGRRWGEAPAAGPASPATTAAPGAISPIGRPSTTGTTGTTSRIGASGRTGTTGPIGAIGATSATPAAGATGATIATPATPSIGPTSATLATGPAGAIGATGATGTIGATIASPVAGATPATPAVGPTSETSATLATGRAGAIGAIGASGASGEIMPLLAGDCPTAGEEHSAQLLQRPQLRLERIHSCQAVSPPGFWYDQAEAEWLLLLQGTARLRFADEASEHCLRPGDSLWIEAHRRHRVTATDPAPGTIWLALFWRES